MAVFDRRNDGGLGSNQQYQKLIAARADTVAPTPTPTPSRRMVDRTAVLSACSTSKDGCSYTSKIRIYCYEQGGRKGRQQGDRNVVGGYNTREGCSDAWLGDLSVRYMPNEDRYGAEPLVVALLTWSCEPR
jgi:hypothetical protein